MSTFSLGSGGASVSLAHRRHILDGDASGGGHRHGTGVPGKTALPKTWNDDKAIAEIESVANDPQSSRRVRPDARTVVEGTRDAVDIRVIIESDGITIAPAHPINKPRNP